MPKIKSKLREDRDKIILKMCQTKPLEDVAAIFNVSRQMIYSIMKRNPQAVDKENS